ncbi:hypothetical protein EMWEY_00012160 [Eimeria maxima]|uniref:Pantothenate kinase n=1 Tax=Eimeria maxima TaxID=5804 RepID=U6M5Z2_EIMMA|nr:hypothetical protein EMWEY_00012160 [Eimeria maxima]CDJ57889.1 hypothetical protein EMWEY_00012160 [Eimeria maxima]
MDSHEELQAFVEDPAANDGSQLPSALTRRAALAAASTAAATASPAATEAASAATVQATLDATADAVEAKRAWAGTCLTNNSESARNHRQCCRQVCIRDPSNSEQQLQRREQVELQLDEFDPARATIPSTDGVCGCRRAFGWKGRHHGGVVLAGCSEGSCEAPAGNCHGHRHHHHHHHHRHHGGSSSSNGSSCRRNRRRCGCHLGEYMFMLIPRKPLSAGASFLFSLLQEASPTVRCAVDMGGTLAKVVFIEELGPHSAAAAAAAAAAVAAGGSTGFSRRDPQLTARAYASNCDAALDLASPLLTIRASPRRVLRFTYFRTKAISSLLECLRTRNLVKGGVLRMTGGGAMKYAKLFTQQLGVSLQRTDEIESIMAGLVLLASHTNSVFRFDLASRQRVPVDVSRDLYPFLVVNIGSGVSILKAKSASSFVRVTGTCIGGGTVLGLARLLFHAKSFRQVVRLSERGTDALDLKVADLCGDAAGSRCIAPDALASSFGRLYLDAKGDRPRPRKEDIARSLIHMVSYNLGYLAYLVGTAHGVRRQG